MISRITTALIAMLILIPSISFAADHKMVIQVNSKDPMTHKMAIANARSLKNQLGNDAVDVEMVVYGPGVSLLRASGDSADAIKAMMSEHDIKVSICEGTLAFIAHNNDGQEPEIIEGVTRVPTGAVRIMELQEQGYAYIRP